MAMKNARDLFAQTDQQISALKERIARQREVIKRAKLSGHSTAAAETIQHTLHESLRAFEKRRQQIFERIEATRGRADKPDVLVSLDYVLRPASLVLTIFVRR